MKVMGMNFVLGDQWDVLSKYSSNSFKKTNPDIPFVSVDFNDSKFHSWKSYNMYYTDKDSPYYEDRISEYNNIGPLKNQVQLECMEKYDVDILIALGADVITCGSWDWVKEVQDCDILFTEDIKYPYNPDVQVVFNKKYYEACNETWLTAHETNTLVNDICGMSQKVHGEMATGCAVFSSDSYKIISIPMHEYRQSVTQCFNKNGRWKIPFIQWSEEKKGWFDSNGGEFLTFHIQCGLGECRNDYDRFQRIWNGCIDYHREGSFLTDDNAWNHFQSLLGRE